MTMQRTVGVTVMPEYLQSEGIDAVLDNLTRRARVNAVATSPYVMAEADKATGSREPPIDAGAGKVRLLDRPLWGKRELWVRTAPSFVPDKKLYEGLRYQPPAANELTRDEGQLVADFIDAAKDRGLQVYFQVQAAIPPGYRVQFGGPAEEDTPRLPDGRIPGRRVDNNGSLASPHIRSYGRALIRDLCQQYPRLDGIRFDWPEYPPYLLDSVFVDFSQHAADAADRLELNFAAMQRDSQRLYNLLHGGLTDEMLDRHFDGLHDPEIWQAKLQAAFPGAAEMLRLKAILSDELLRGFRETMTQAAPHMQLIGYAFPPPWSIASGLDFARAATLCDTLAVKLYGMHWAMMLHFYGEQLLQSNPNLTESTLVRSLVRLLGIATGDDDCHTGLNSYRYPEPDQPHPIGRRAQLVKIRAAQEAAGNTPVLAFAHGYGPVEDFRRRITSAAEASRHGIWVNRYGYLSDEKLDAIGGAA